MRILVAVISCHRDRAKNQAQRDTCFKEVSGADVRFFYGGGQQQKEDEVILECDDGYAGLPNKVCKMLAWALDQGYDYIFRCDSDVYVQIDRLIKATPVGHDYCGRLRGPSGNYPAPYASGFAYWLSAKAAAIRISEQTDDIAEDRATGNILTKHGIKCKADYRYAVVTSTKNAKSATEGPMVGNDIIAACEFSEEGLYAVHRQWLECLSSPDVEPMPTGTPFSDICILVKTIARDGMLRRCVSLIEEFMPGAKIVIMDDGMETKDKVEYYAKLRRKGHACGWLSFDSGFGAKSNAAKEHYDRKYVLIFSDDFEASEAVANDVYRMRLLLDKLPNMGVVSGRVDDNPYEANVVETEREDGRVDVVLAPINYKVAKFEEVDGIEYMPCDLTVNYNLVRTEVIKNCLWDETHPIGGDHYNFYRQVYGQGYDICYLRGATISQMKRFAGSEDPMYGSLRGRARFALPDLFKRNNWASFTMMDGTKDTPETVQAWADKHTKYETIQENGRIDKSGLRLARRNSRRERREERRAKQLLDGSIVSHQSPSRPVQRYSVSRPPVAKKGLRSRRDKGR